MAIKHTGNKKCAKMSINRPIL